MKKTLLIITASALVTAAAIKAAPAVAAATGAGETVVSVVRTADLDLSSISGQRQLEARLVRAAREVCGEASNVDLKGSNDAAACRDEVLAAARSKAQLLLAGAAADRTITVAARP